MINAPANLSEEDAIEWHERFVGLIPKREPADTRDDQPTEQPDEPSNP